jgi:hypothetical protein
MHLLGTRPPGILGISQRVVRHHGIVGTHCWPGRGVGKNHERAKVALSR